MTVGQNDHPLQSGHAKTCQYLVRVSAVPKGTRHCALGKISIANTLPSASNNNIVANTHTVPIKSLATTLGQYQPPQKSFPLVLEKGVISMYTRLYPGKSKSCDDSVAHRSNAFASCLGALSGLPELESVAFCTSTVCSPFLSTEEASEYMRLLRAFNLLRPLVRIMFFDVQTVSTTATTTTEGYRENGPTRDCHQEMYSLCGYDFGEFLQQIKCSPPSSPSGYDFVLGSPGMRTNYVLSR